MKWKKVLVPALGAAASAATAGLVDPVTGGALAASLLAGGAAKKVGKDAERKHGRPVHKVGAPVAAIAAPAAGLAIAHHAGANMGHVCAAAQAIVDALCGNPAATGAAIGAVGILVHSIASGLSQAGTPRG